MTRRMFASNRRVASFLSTVVTFATLIASGVAGAQPSTIIIVRHGEKATKPADDPPLTAAGKQRAKDLAAALAGANVATVISTQFQRSQATARPIADAIGKTTIVEPATSDPQVHAAAVAAKARSAGPGSVVLIVGHSNTVPLIIAALGGPKIPDLCDGEYANLFVMEFPASGTPRLIRAKYGAADPDDADRCTRGMKRP